MSSMFQTHINDQHQFEVKCATIGNKELCFLLFITKRQPGQKNVMLARFIAWFPFSDLHYNAQQQHTVAHPQLVTVGDIIAQQRLCVEGEPPFSAATPT